MIPCAWPLRCGVARARCSGVNAAHREPVEVRHVRPIPTELRRPAQGWRAYLGNAFRKENDSNGVVAMMGEASCALTGSGRVPGVQCAGIIRTGWNRSLSMNRAGNVQHSTLNVERSKLDVERCRPGFMVPMRGIETVDATNQAERQGEAARPVRRAVQSTNVRVVSACLYQDHGT